MRGTSHDTSGAGLVFCSVLLALALNPAPWAEESESPPAKRRGVVGLIDSGDDGKGRDSGSFFVDRSGVPTLTNRLDRYRGDPDYLEVRIVYRPIVVPGRYAFNGGANAYDAADVVYLVNRYATQYDLDANLVLAVIKVESDFDPYAVSRSGARGLMQLMPATALEMRVTDIYDTAQNIAGGTQYLSRLMNHFDRELDLALAAYNAGPETVRRFGGVPPYKETKAYVKKVRRWRGIYAENGPDIHFKLTSRRPLVGHLPQAKTKAPYILRFASGTTQPADKLIDKDPYYVIEFGGRQYTIRKDLVVHVERNL